MCLLDTVVTEQSLFTFPLKSLAHFASLLLFPPQSCFLQAEQPFQFLQPFLSEDTEKHHWGLCIQRVQHACRYLPRRSATKQTTQCSQTDP